MFSEWGCFGKTYLDLLAFAIFEIMCKHKEHILCCQSVCVSERVCVSICLSACAVIMHRYNINK